jgi:hypothetical protein
LPFSLPFSLPSSLSLPWLPPGDPTESRFDCSLRCRLNPTPEEAPNCATVVVQNESNTKIV